MTPVAGVAVKVTLVTVHVKLPDELAPGTGGVTSCETATVAVALQPVVLSVTVTVYVPGALTDFVCDVPPPLHA